MRDCSNCTATHAEHRVESSIRPGEYYWVCDRCYVPIHNTRERREREQQAYTCDWCEQPGATHPFHHDMTPWHTRYLCDECFATADLADPEPLTARELAFERREFQRMRAE